MFRHEYFSIACLYACSLGMSLCQTHVGHAADSQSPTFEQAVRPLLAARCFKCHDENTPKGELNLTNRMAILKGGESGAVLVSGKPEESVLYELVHAGQMPPKGETPLTEPEKQTIHDWIVAGMPFAETPSATEDQISQHDVIPILWLRCTICHGTHQQEGGLDLRTKAGMLKGGKSGPAIVPGNPAESLLLKKIQAEEMPPRRRVVEVSIKPIEPTEVDLLTKWIAAGAPESPLGADVATTEPDPLVPDADREFWSFQPPRWTPVPEVTSNAHVRNAIDPWILEKLSEHQLTVSREADRSVLIRRLTFDLIGLPPTPTELDDFANDHAPDAWERLSDRLLASPHYGERWARYWLDLAGYADSTGVQHADPMRDQIWRYRDYVIQAFNSDKPYDRFLAEQIAGDELADYERAPEITPEIYDNLVATSFLRLTPDGTHANITNFVPDRLDIIADELNVLTSSVMGLTMKCARCHTHKSDPIPQRDYYRLSAIFKGALDEHDWLRGIYQVGNKGPWGERRLSIALPAERLAWELRDRELNQERDQLRSVLASKTEELQKTYFENRLAQLPASERESVREAVNLSAEQRNDSQKALAEKYETMLRLNADELKKLEPDYKTLAEQTESKLKSVESRRTLLPTIQALWDQGSPSPTYILRRGDHKKFGREVGPGVPAVLTNGRTPFVVEPPWPGAKQTGRRLAFARWLTQPDQPLTARVIVNRLWRHHFGAGLVTTLDNFGKTGSPPSHPQLLDQLALEMQRGQWSLKRMQRWLVSSATYRQSSLTTDVNEQRDPDNTYLAHMPLRRLEAETLRDALLAVADQLDDRAGGLPDDVETAASGLVTDKGSRRSIYVLQRRTTILTLMEDFDLPAMSPNCVDRPLSTVAPQALHLLNSRVIQQRAEQFAARVRQLAGDDLTQQIEIAWRLGLGRTPTADEMVLTKAQLQQLTDQWAQQASDDRTPAEHALINLCHALINSAEFVMLD